MWHLFFVVSCLLSSEVPNAICYHEKSTLDVSLFKGRPIPEMGRKIYGEFGISYHSDFIGNGAAVEVCAYLNPTRSFYLPDYSIEELCHERTRWRIYHLAALEMVQFGCRRKVSLNTTTTILLSDIEQKYRDMDRSFNLQTKFGKVKEQEVSWNLKLDSIYSSLRLYEDSVWYQ